MGKSTNNTTEFRSLEIGLEILSHERMTTTIMEGDSTLVINTVKRLQNGTRVGKVQRHWRLGHSLQNIRERLQKMNTMDLHWVCRSTNVLVERIANEWANKEGLELDTTWSNIPNYQFRTDCIQLVTKDCDDNLSTECHIERSGARLIGGHDESRKNLHGKHPITSENAGSDHTIDGGTTSRSH
jgi:ribonuclease HI